MAGPATAPASKVVRLLDRNAFSVMQMTKAARWQVNRRLCARPQGDSALKPSNGPSGPSSGVPGHKPSNWDKKILVWTGRFKKAEDIPETLSFKAIDNARSKIRVQMAYLMIAFTAVGCLVMVILGKQAVARNESLTSLNLEKKARLREEAQSTLAKP
ncbi:protein FAM162A-like [Heteronotia binoei]|uniref:protein FAM162A-like n=1 Tax=Heteronotia binoei TaxID=13085 RepID=UPI00292F918A|nr:protein FAM162A-like [Heteronotia binoei]